MENTSKTPLHFFDKLIIPDGHSYWKYKTIKSIEDRVQGALDSVDYELGEIKYIHSYFDKEKEEVETDNITYNFSKDFHRKIDIEITEAKNKIENIVIDIFKRSDEPKKFLLSQVKQIYYLMDKAKLDCPEFNLEPLDNLASFLIEKYSLKHINRKKFINQFTSNSFFGIRQEVKPSLINNIYDEVSILEIIDDEIVSESAFINVLTQDPTIHDDVIKFKCNNQLAVHFINIIMPLFNNFTYSQICKSQKFFNKKALPKVLNQSDLDTANTRLNKDLKRYKVMEISRALSDLIPPS